MSTQRSKSPVNKQIIEEAAEWFVELNESDADNATRERFDAWLRLSPEHVRAYLRVLPVWEEGSNLEGQANGDPQALIAWARESANVIPLDPQRSGVARAAAESGNVTINSWKRPSWRASLAASAAFLCLGVLLTAWFLSAHRSIYDTNTGEQHLIALNDGSKVTLNSRSKIKVRFTATERSVELLEGQALFSVAKDAMRPFIVRSGKASVRAIGTQFDVYKKRTGTVVTVVEGRVAILSNSSSPASSPAIQNRGVESSSVVLSAGEQALVNAVTAPKPAPANVAMATAWTQQRLEFSRTPLLEVADEFNRYNKRQIVVKDGELTAFNVSGTFSSSDPASLLKFLRAQPGIHVSETAAMISISQDR